MHLRTVCIGFLEMHLNMDLLCVAIKCGTLNSSTFGPKDRSNRTPYRTFDLAEV